MADEVSPSVNAHELWRIENAEALAIVDARLGPSEAWAASALLEYRLSANFQADWKAEVGHWLHVASTHGFLEAMLHPIFGERDRRARNETRDVHDQRHLKLHQHLTCAMICHYCTGLGWSFAGWETETGGAIDIDLALRAPDGTLVELQVKAPDRPMKLENGHYHDGDFDNRVIDALENAVAQLPQPARSVAMVGMFAQRTRSLPGNPRCLLQHLYGAGYPGDDELLLPRQAFGKFMSRDLDHVAGVLLFDILRGVDVVRYPCTVLLNPNASRPASPDWFPRSRVLVLDGDRFRWIRGEPWVPIHGLPSGTRVVDTVP